MGRQARNQERHFNSGRCQQLAIFALPRAIDEDEALHKDGILNSNSDSESIRGSTDDEYGQSSLLPKPKDFENKLEKVVRPSDPETIYDGDSVSDGPDIGSVNSRASHRWGEIPDPSAPEYAMGQFSSKVSPSTQKKHKCKLCDKRFTRPSSLQTHMYSHTEEKPFSCEFEGCGRTFSIISNLRRHRKVHRSDAHLEEGCEDADGDHSQNLPKRHYEILRGSVSTRPPRATSNSVFTSDIQTSPAQQDSEPNSQIPFAVPLHPTPKTYRSQSYSVAHLDPETAWVMSSDSPVLQHPPSRPSMPSELANDDNILGKAEGVEDDDDEKLSGSQFIAHTSKKLRILPPPLIGLASLDSVTGLLPMSTLPVWFVC
ncbi:hypothetical protein CEP52_004491 [Fusarium oligoseptatum]|uniref:C2H2-type domain-containing protein n=1 Tax=Fusarium oligoseptatum TaxID=2604345 RepID=A0A428U3A2_9HYPO|nr:hypothetical protein CEP52_004491 [Fusarium oligoseptatum]